MEQDVVNYLNMIGGVLSTLRKDNPTWEKETEMIDVVTLIETDYLSILNLSKNIEGLQTTGLTELKDLTFDLIIHKTLKLSKKVSAYAKKNKKLDLLPLVNHSYSSLSDGMEKEVIARCKAILDAATANLANLTTFKATAGEITTIKQYISDYESYVNNRSSTTTTRTTSVTEVSTLVSNIRENIDILDDTVEGVLEDEGVIARYQASRKIVDYGTGKTAKKTKTTETEKK
jgi:hypothetical protein